MKRRYIALLIFLAVFIGLSFVPMFPDPYHKEGTVTFWEWCKREIDELLHGEK